MVAVVPVRVAARLSRVYLGMKVTCEVTSVGSPAPPKVKLAVVLALLGSKLANYSGAEVAVRVVTVADPAVGVKVRLMT